MDNKKNIMSRKNEANETAVLVLALTITLGLVGCAFWWLANNFPKNSSLQVLQSNPESNTFAQVPNVPSGLFSHGGSTTWASIRREVDPLIQTAQPQFRLRYTDPTTGAPGTTSGIKMLLNNQLAFSESSRSIKPEEHQQAQHLNITLKEIPVAIDGIAIAVNPNLNIPGLTLAQLKDIYTGKITNWKQVGGPELAIIPYSRHLADGGTIQFFEENVLEKEKFAANVQFIPRTTQALQEVARNRGGIYYASAPEIVGQCTVKPLSIGHQSAHLIPPYALPFVSLEQCPQQRNQINAAAFQSGEYPITRRLFVIVKQNGQSDQQAGEAYVNFLQTDQGKKLITKAGFVTIR